MQFRVQLVENYIRGFIQPSVILRISEDMRADKSLENSLSRLSDILRLPPYDQILDQESLSFASQCPATPIVRIISFFCENCGDQRFSKINVSYEDHDFVYSIPTLSTALTQTCTRLLLELIKDGPDQISPKRTKSMLLQCKSACRQYLPRGTNPGNFIAAAAHHKVPFRIFANTYLILGYGSGSTLLKSSISDKEGNIGVSLARSKVQTHDFLQLSGFPVANQARVKSIEDAISRARRFGFPVVLKPEDEEQGRGVRANILDEVELRSCFDEISKNYNTLLLEKHIFGDHYRIAFMGDQLIKAVRHRPASVIGDGEKTIQDLIHILNSNPHRRDPNSSMKQVIVDDDLKLTLTKQGKSLKCVPRSGEHVLLRSISNLSRGGEQDNVEDIIHEENLRLCQSVARAMRLDVVGIDLLSPDLTRPWYETRTVICEVNAQPQLGIAGTKIYWEFLRRYLKPPVPIKIIISNVPRRSDTPLFDTDCTTLEIWLKPEDILRNGCPTQYFSELEICDDVSPSEMRKLKKLLVSVPPDYVVN